MSSFLPQKPLDEGKLDAALALMDAGRFSAAFRVLCELQADDHAGALFARGVCLFRAGEYFEAAVYFEKSLTALKKIRPLGRLTTKPDIYRILRKQEIAQKVYLKPFRLGMVSDDLSLIISEDIMMAAADAYIHCGNTDKAKTLISALNGSEFDEIKSLIYSK